jgi:Mrp family chromosome partitioning ATPase
VINGQQAAALASVADGVVLVVEAERTHVVDIIRARETLEQLGASIIGLVLNKRRRRIPKFISRFL